MNLHSNQVDIKSFNIKLNLQLLLMMMSIQQKEILHHAFILNKSTAHGSAKVSKNVYIGFVGFVKSFVSLLEVLLLTLLL
jgi:hypothetical protein